MSIELRELYKLAVVVEQSYLHVILRVWGLQNRDPWANLFQELFSAFLYNGCRSIFGELLTESLVE